MWRALRIFVAIAVVAALAIWLSDNPGRVTLTWQGWRIDTSMALLATAVAIFAVAAALIYRGWLALRAAPRRLGDAWRWRRRQQGYQALTRGMVAVAAGDADEAHRQARRADVLLNEPPLTMLLSAQAAQLAGDDKAAARFFTAMGEREETAFLGVRGLLMQAMKRGADDEARSLARRAWRLRPKSEWVAGVLFDLEARGGRWREARAVLEDAQRQKLISREIGVRRDAVLSLELACEAVARGDKTEAMRCARSAHASCRDLVVAAAIVARGLADEGKHGRARSTIEESWSSAPHPDLAAIYLQDASEEPLERVKAIQRLVRSAPDHPESRYALAAALADAKLWGEARKTIDGFGDNPPARVCRLMAEIEEREHGNLIAARQWLVRATLADPDPAWVCGTCGNISREWRAVCAKCRAFDTHSWRAPPHVMALAPAGGEGQRGAGTTMSGRRSADAASVPRNDPVSSTNAPDRPTSGI